MARVTRQTRTSPAGHPADEDLLLEQQLCFALTVAARSVVGAYKPVLDTLGLTHPQYLVMLCLWEASPRSVRDISDALAQEPATISPLLRRLETAVSSPGSAGTAMNEPWTCGSPLPAARSGNRRWPSPAR